MPRPSAAATWGCNPSAHRLAADRELRAGPTAKNTVAAGVDHLAVAGLQLVIPVGHASALLSVEKIEGDRVDAARRKRARKAHHEAARLAGAGAGAVGEDQANARMFASRRRIGDRRHLLGGRDVDAHTLGHRKGSRPVDRRRNLLTAPFRN